MKTVRYATAGGVVLAGDRVLVLLRPGRGEVRLPKGKLEPDEAAEDTAVREVREEAGFRDVEIVADLGAMTVEFDRLEDDGTPMHIVRDERYWLMRLASPSRVERPAEDEEQFIADFRSIDEALETLTYEPEREWVRRALAAAPA